MDLQMIGKAALVTGASAGIGKAITFALAREGVDVAICARRPEPLQAAASQIARETNRKIVPIPADLTKPADAEAFVKEAHTALGRIDILVNNAGSAPGGVLEFLTEEHWAQSLQLKFKQTVWKHRFRGVPAISIHLDVLSEFSEAGKSAENDLPSAVTLGNVLGLIVRRSDAPFRPGARRSTLAARRY
jgi:NAD(P)-dependent dehydrogenase (short-subunit alcohol dehydrogenase family)